MTHNLHGLGVKRHIHPSKFLWNGDHSQGEKECAHRDGDAGVWVSQIFMEPEGHWGTRPMEREEG